MDDILKQSGQWVAALSPNVYVQAFVIVVFFLILAKLFDKILCSMVRRLVSRTASKFDDRVIDNLHRPLFGTIAIFGLTLAAYRMDLQSQLETITLSILKTIVILLWVKFSMVFAHLVLEVVSDSRQRFPFAQKDTMPLLRNLAVVVVFMAGAYAILIAWDINVTGLVASAGIVGLALSFAAQDTLGHLFAGVAILADRPYKVGDYVVLDSGERGEVTTIGLRSTRLLTRDDVEVTVPNGVMGSAKIVNESGGPHEKFRVRVSVGVAYGTDIYKVIDILNDVAAEHEEVCDQPEPRVRFRAFGESGLDFELLAWVEQPVLRGRVVHELNCAVYDAFKESGISIPFPQRDLYIKEMPGSGGSISPSAS